MKKVIHSIVGTFLAAVSFGCFSAKDSTAHIPGVTGLDPENEKHSERIREITAQLMLIREAKGETENIAASKVR